MAEQPERQPVRFTYEGLSYEIDLTVSDAEALLKVVQPASWPVTPKAGITPVIPAS